MIHVLGRCKRDTTPTFLPLLSTPPQATKLQGLFLFFNLFLNPPALSKSLSVFSNVSPHQHSSSITSILNHSGFCSGPCVPQPRRLSSPPEVFPTPPTAHTRYPPMIKFNFFYSFQLQGFSCLSWVVQPLATTSSSQLTRLTPARMCSSLSCTSRPIPHPQASQS